MELLTIPILTCMKSDAEQQRTMSGSTYEKQMYVSSYNSIVLEQQNMKLSKHRQYCSHHENYQQPESDFVYYGRIVNFFYYGRIVVPPTRFAEADVARSELRGGDLARK